MKKIWLINLLYCSLQIFASEQSNAENPEDYFKTYAFWADGENDALQQGKTFFDNIQNESFQKTSENLKLAASVFSGMLYRCDKEHIQYTGEIRELLKSFETFLARCISQGMLDPRDIWIENKPIRRFSYLSKKDLKTLHPDSLTTLEFAKLNVCDSIKICEEGQNAPPKFMRLPSNFIDGGTLIIGEKRTTYNSDEKNYYVDMDDASNPDMVALADSQASLVFIPDKKFSRIEFRFLKLSFLQNEDLLFEYKRILQDDGTISFRSKAYGGLEFQREKENLDLCFEQIKQIFPQLNQPEIIHEQGKYYLVLK